MDINLRTVRPAAILTTSYVAGTVLEDVQKYNNLQLLIDFTKGSLIDAQIKVEQSLDNSDWYELGSDTIATGVNTLDANITLLNETQKRSVSYPINTRFIRVSAIGTGTVTDSSLKIQAILGKVE